MTWVHIETGKCETCPKPEELHPIGSAWVCPICDTEYQVIKLNQKVFLSSNPVLWPRTKYNLMCGRKD